MKKKFRVFSSELFFSVGLYSRSNKGNRVKITLKLKVKRHHLHFIVMDRDLVFLGGFWNFFVRIVSSFWHFFHGCSFTLSFFSFPQIFIYTHMVKLMKILLGTENPIILEYQTYHYYHLSRNVSTTKYVKSNCCFKKSYKIFDN